MLRLLMNLIFNLGAFTTLETDEDFELNVGLLHKKVSQSDEIVQSARAKKNSYFEILKTWNLQKSSNSIRSCKGLF